ncbi:MULTISPECIES: methionine ABC transporter ATP-binding protein [Rhizobium]|uniref:methionine ABC transporter ATP-binding protein n=1 Tax=Rhizobium TaxID=379 RepID=UPI000BEA494A|nr:MULTISPECIES: methionine ABC transporter ATP-binding protein [Rhizobium]MBY4591840.1 methionine ABC transporter ATP-binding protein [Rhizobium redzepovicii]MBY4616260.1 methionine ABC transporter ATP-binding protein [Rhizobium redzepovicii]MDF0662491.1 methionine ABC transporter ATP-binding protein [Rhizobium sp. BC49]PDS83615.1 methionine ABC transporter ATP-binding protein [Rhizobium sp. L18]TBY46053.1 methionine ABC transporter ATP-binding protein [Rhizobium leguminosarum bv. viciae]
MNSFVSTTAIEAEPQTATEEVVRLTEVKRRFGTTAALDGISLTVKRGEILGIIGRSGAGKSTLIRCLNGLERADSGEILIEGRDITGLSEQDLQPLRRRIGMIFQHFNLLSAKTVEENVALPLKIEGLAKSERLKRAHELLELVALADRAKAYPASLSGGQKQRVGIARALAARPALLLSDEATSALDPETTRSILTLLKDINRKLGLTILLITHEMEVVRGIADRVAVIDAGRIVEEGQVWSIFANPQADITGSLLGGIRPQLPEHIAGRLSATAGSEAILSVDLAGPQAQGALFAELSAALPHSFRLVHGGIDHIQNQPVARFFIAVPARDPALAGKVQKFLTARSARVEVLGYDTDHA